MLQRTDYVTAERVDAALILLPLIGWLEASFTPADNGVPLEVAARVMTSPVARRQVEIAPILVV